MQEPTRPGVRDGEPDTLSQGALADWKPPSELTVPGLTILDHPNVERIGEIVTLPALASGKVVRLSRLEPAFGAPGSSALAPLADPYLSRQPILFSATAESLRIDPAGSPIPLQVDGAPVTEARQLPIAALQRGVVLLLGRRIVLLLSRIDPAPGSLGRHFGLVGESPAMLNLYREITRVAARPVPVLLRGETGTGKELVAKALHDASERRGRPFVAVNMAAVPATLAAAELFGATRGAFTGADRERPGYFQRARGGTLFLDEIGEAPLDVQAALLRALETREVQPVGGAEPQVIDVRWIAATDADLERAAADGRFRAPLLHRLAGYEIRLPPLAARREDLGRLLLAFLREELALVGRPDRLKLARPEALPWLPAELVAEMAAYPWPGNIRQLRNVARRLVVLGAELAQLPTETRLASLVLEVPAERRSAPESKAPEPERAEYRDPEEVTEEEMLAALKAHGWRIQRAAEELGLSRTSLYAKIDASSKIRKASDLERNDIEAALDRAGGDVAAASEALEVSRRGLQLRIRQLKLDRDR